MSYVVNFRGHPACPCLAEWLPVFEAELIRRGVVKSSIDIAQLIGGAAASAGVHRDGGAFDIWQTDDTTVWVARQMGADATWARVTGSFATNRHTHGVLTGCPHNGPARYQIDEVRADGDGLIGSAPDPGPRPLSGRTWREGIAWATQLQEDEDMTPENIDKIVAALRPVIAAETAKAVANNRLDVGRPNKLGDDQIMESVIARLVSIDKSLAILLKGNDRASGNKAKP